MPYTIRKQKCKQADGDSGSYVLSYTSKKGKKYNNCHTSKKGAQDQIAAIEGPREMAENFKELLKKEVKKAIAEIASDESKVKHNRHLDEELLVRKEDRECFIEYIKETCRPENIQEAEYQGRQVKLNKVTRTTGDKKFQVYVKDPKTKNIKKISFGDGTGLSIKTKDPDRRRNFRARHNCDTPGPKTKARYWSCRMWSGPDAVKNMLKK
tara:strand:- start:27 stop:656 length:630 start_codon:yes stop_codon:yes gene_type:complete